MKIITHIAPLQKFYHIIKMKAQRKLGFWQNIERNNTTLFVRNLKKALCKQKFCLSMTKFIKKTKSSFQLETINYIFCHDSVHDFDC